MAKKSNFIYPTVSITFPVFNGGREPLECLASVYALDYPREKIEVIVIDNNSTDGSDDLIELKFPRVKLFKMKENLGFAKGVNLGIKKSTGEYIFIGNDDLVFEKDSLKRMIEYMLDHPLVGVLGGKIYLKDRPQIVCSSGYMMNKWTGNVFRATPDRKIQEPDWIQGCAMLIPRDVLKKTGLLDEDYSLAYFEDFDLCLRVKNEGYSVTYIPTAHFRHGQSTTVNKNLSFKYYQWYKNKIRFILKNMPFLNIVSILLLQCFFVSPYRALVLRDGRFIPFLKGFFWNTTHLSQTLAHRMNTKKINKITAATSL